MLTIAFLQDNHNHPGYTGASLHAGGVGGTESSVIQLAEALAALGHRIWALNRIDAPVIEETGVTWMPLREKKDLPPLDIAIGINSARIFDGVKARRTISWLHNPPALRQQLKRRTLGALLRHRPHAVLLSSYQSRLLHRWLPYSGRSVIHHGIGDAFFAPGLDMAPRPRRAIFTSQPSRGLAFCAACWETVIAAMPSAELHIFCPQAKQEDAVRTCSGRDGIVIRGSVTRLRLAQELRLSRVMLAPGVADETFCLAAAEATASGVPIVTLGAGALSERVKNGETGFIAKTADEFAAYTVRLLRDDALWQAQHEACLSDAELASWSERAKQWERLFAKLLAES